MSKSNTKKIAKTVAKSAKAEKSTKRRVLHTDTQKISVKVKGNPFRKGTDRAKTFARIRSGMTVAAAAKAVGRRFLRRCEWRKVITIG